ncbi:MAG: branched-chain amino acid ABC transporter permease [Dethiobacter sp.]|nr:branched-chain amino acid ABC transporter permease [Dethiobacter sp.]
MFLIDLQTFIQLLVSGLLFGGIYTLVSVGLTLTLGVMNIVNLAHGDFLMISLYAIYWMFELYNIHPYISLLVVIILMFVLGLLVERFIIRPTIDKPRHVHIFATLGLSLILQNLALMFWTGNFRTIRIPIAQLTWEVGGVFLNFSRILIFAVALFAALLIYLFLKYTWIGRAIRATSQDRNAAMLMGINIDKVFMITFAIGISTLGLAAGLLLPLYFVYPTVGFQFTLVAVVIIVMGGLGSIKGAIIASIFIGIVETLSGYFIDPAMKQAIYFIIFICVLIFKPSGLFGKKLKVA